MFSFREKKDFIILGSFALLALLGILFFALSKPKTGGYWVCRGGEWVAVGKPAEKMPKAKCY